MNNEDFIFISSLDFSEKCFILQGSTQIDIADMEELLLAVVQFESKNCKEKENNE